jgi:AcrR family transcriptional regulator
MSAPPKRRLTAEERRTGILDAALSVFSQRGFHAASIDDIAAEAGVSKALIYEHFSSKQELYGDLIARNARELTQRVSGALVGIEFESTAERLATGLEAFFAFVEERRDAWRMLFRDPSDPESAAVLDRRV